MMCSTTVRQFYREAEPFCRARLEEAFNPGTGIFDRQLRYRKWDVTRGTESITSTAICLLGANRAGMATGSMGLDKRRSLRTVVELICHSRYLGAIGLVIWANAVCDLFPIQDLLLPLSLTPKKLRDHFHALNTMEMAWLVSGLAHEWNRTRHHEISGPLEEATERLLERYEEDNHLFFHAGEGAPTGKRIRKRVANFADQIYSVLALSHVSRSVGSDRGLAAAKSCARKLAELQGNQGQWWWHYDASRGDVAQMYPVYSVHQYGMAPMAFSALDIAADMSLGDAAWRGINWLFDNELQLTMLDTTSGTIWRDIEYGESSVKRFVRFVWALSTKKSISRKNEGTDLRLNYETRPYEWAWCLYAGAIADDREKSLHIV